MPSIRRIKIDEGKYWSPKTNKHDADYQVVSEGSELKGIGCATLVEANELFEKWKKDLDADRVFIRNKNGTHIKDFQR